MKINKLFVLAGIIGTFSVTVISIAEQTNKNHPEEVERNPSSELSVSIDSEGTWGRHEPLQS